MSFSLDRFLLWVKAYQLMRAGKFKAAAEMFDRLEGRPREFRA